MSGPLSGGGIYHKSQPTAHEQFRANTAKHASLAGVTRPTFLCRCCGRRKTAEGRKRISPKYPRDGYKCADCAKPSA